MNDEEQLPSVTLQPSVQATRPKEFPSIVAMSDDDGNSYLCVPCIGMEVTMQLSVDDMQKIIDVLTERIQEDKEMRL